MQSDYLYKQVASKTAMQIEIKLLKDNYCKINTALPWNKRLKLNVLKKKKIQLPSSFYFPTEYKSMDVLSFLFFFFG